MTQSLILLLRTPRQCRVIACIRPYIPKHHLNCFNAELNWPYVVAAEAAMAQAAKVEVAKAEAAKAEAVEAEPERRKRKRWEHRRNDNAEAVFTTSNNNNPNDNEDDENVDDIDVDTDAILVVDKRKKSITKKSRFPISILQQFLCVSIPWK